MRLQRRLPALEAAQKKASEELAKFNNDVLNRQLQELYRSMSSQTMTKVTEAMSAPGAGGMPRDWELITDLSGKPVDKTGENEISVGHDQAKDLKNGIYSAAVLTRKCYTKTATFLLSPHREQHVRSARPTVI